MQSNENDYSHIKKSSQPQENQVVYQDYPVNFREKVTQEFMELEDVRDWRERIKNYDQKTKEIYEKCFEKHNYFVS